MDRGARNHIDVCILFTLWFSSSVDFDGFVGVIISQVHNDLNRISEIGTSFKYSGRNISLIGVINVQFKALPPRIAAILKIKVGVEQKISLSLVKFIGRQLFGAHIVARRNRIV